MFPYQCPSCDERGHVADAERANKPCSLCTAESTWETLPPETQSLIDAAIRRGPMPAAPVRRHSCAQNAQGLRLVAMRVVTA